MGSSSTVQIDRLRVGKRNIKRSDSSLSILERNMTTMNHIRLRSLKRLTRRILRALRNGMISIAELELNHITSRGSNHIRYKSILRSTDNDRDDSISSRGQRWILSNCEMSDPFLLQSFWRSGLTSQGLVLVKRGKFSSGKFDKRHGRHGCSPQESLDHHNEWSLT